MVIIRGDYVMGKKNKVALMLVITLLFNIFYTSNVFATNLNTNILQKQKEYIQKIKKINGQSTKYYNILTIAIKIYKLEMKLILICH